MTKYFNSGLYELTFYAKHEIDYHTDTIIEDIEYNMELLMEYYAPDLEEYKDENDKWDAVEEIFWDNLSYWSTYFKPLIFDEKVALECGLTPFTYKGIDMLALSGCGMNLSPKLDAYQVLVHNTIDRCSTFFSKDNQGDKYFEYVVGKDVTNRVRQALGI
ncbi:hypothetical protein [Candidatus Tisiphia endosymbiont of Nedyus quadrimaculatus]|uniref:hypothetical protein n=1 Tax=Candidatus Tisiphia endosymbiont of Nedyus quadrimaculatus TaxID=3139332 RepID=UPI00345ED186